MEMGWSASIFLIFSQSDLPNTSSYKLPLEGFLKIHMEEGCSFQPCDLLKRNSIRNHFEEKFIKNLLNISY